MDNRTYKHLAKGLRTYAERTMANIHTCGVKKLLLFGVLLLLSVTEKLMRKIDLKLILPTSSS
jgi:hypothetical protein